MPYPVEQKKKRPFWQHPALWGTGALASSALLADLLLNRGGFSKSLLSKITPSSPSSNIPIKPSIPDAAVNARANEIQKYVSNAAVSGGFAPPAFRNRPGAETLAILASDAPGALTLGGAGASLLRIPGAKTLMSKVSPVMSPFLYGKPTGGFFSLFKPSNLASMLKLSPELLKLKNIGFMGPAGGIALGSDPDTVAYYSKLLGSDNPENPFVKLLTTTLGGVAGAHPVGRAATVPLWIGKELTQQAISQGNQMAASQGAATSAGHNILLSLLQDARAGNADPAAIKAWLQKFPDYNKAATPAAGLGPLSSMYTSWRNWMYPQYSEPRFLSPRIQQSVDELKRYAGL